MTDLEYLNKYLPKNKIEEGIKKLKQGIPVQYIVGNVDFYGSIIKVNPSVLIPRFETELLVEKAIKIIKQEFNNTIDIVDIGTGSGCIAISLKKELKCNMDAIDISKEALSIAKENAKENEVNINFYEGNLLSPVDKKYDVIISNPPYISQTEEIMEIVKNNEPELALYAKNNGLFFYEEILKNSQKYLKSKFLIAFEIGYLQAEAIKSLAFKYLKNITVTIENDFSNKNRFVFIKSINNNE